LESSKLVVLVRDFSLCLAFYDGNVARELGVYFTVEARNDTQRQRAHSGLKPSEEQEHNLPTEASIRR
jgi:hypothetical protein